MFMAFVAIATVALALIQLGALSVWVEVLALSLKVVFVAISVVALFFVWRRITR